MRLYRLLEHGFQFVDQGVFLFGQENEVVRVDARADVCTFLPIHDCIGQHTQQLIPLRITDGVVDDLEIIDVELDDHEFCPGMLG